MRFNAPFGASGDDERMRIEHSPNSSQWRQYTADMEMVCATSLPQPK